MKKLTIILIFLGMFLPGNGQIIQVDTTFNIENLCLQQSIAQQHAILPYHLAPGGIPVTDFVINWDVINHKLVNSPSIRVQNYPVGPLPINIIGVGLSITIKGTDVPRDKKIIYHKSGVYINPFYDKSKIHGKE